MEFVVYCSFCENDGKQRKIYEKIIYQAHKPCTHIDGKIGIKLSDTFALFQTEEANQMLQCYNYRKQENQVKLGRETSKVPFNYAWCSSSYLFFQ